MHFDHEGDLCPFVRTAHSPGGKSLSIEERDRRRETQKALRAKLLAEKEAAAALERERKRARQREFIRQENAMTTNCPVCGEKVKWVRNRGELSAHQKPDSRRWCKGGVEPTERQRAQSRKHRSVWTISGGLPTLGKRR